MKLTNVQLDLLERINFRDRLAREFPENQMFQFQATVANLRTARVLLDAGLIRRHGETRQWALTPKGMLILNEWEFIK